MDKIVALKPRTDIVENSFFILFDTNTNNFDILCNFPCTHSRTHSDVKFMKIEKILKTLNLKNGLLSNVWWARQDSNLGPIHYESTALTS